MACYEYNRDTKTKVHEISCQHYYYYKDKDGFGKIGELGKTH